MIHSTYCRPSSKAFLCAVMLFFYSALALSIERVMPDERSGIWIVDGYEIYVEMPCRLSRSTFSLPTKNCSQPYIVINQKSPQGETFSTPRYFILVAGKVSIGDKWMFDGNDDPMKKVPISDLAFGPQKSPELFALLMSAPGTPLTIKTRSGSGAPIATRTVVLSDFDVNASELIRAIHRNYDDEQATARRNLTIGIGVLGGVLVFGFWLVIFLLKRGRMRLQATKDKFEMKRVARIAEDEVIRETVRSSVERADESELNALRNHIKVALDSGDTEAAEKLLNVLKKIEPKPPRIGN